MTTPSTTVRVEKHEAVTLIVIDRPDRRNALDIQSSRRLGEAFRAFDADESARVAVLTGEGGCFCAGADLKEMSAGPLYEPWGGGEDGILGAPLSKPMLAAVEGYAVAGGLGLALYCDLRIADTTAVFGVFCRRFGVPMSDGTPVRLPRLIGESRALDMVLTGRPVDADEALAIGLANRVVPAGAARAAALDLAGELARVPQLAMRADRLSLLGQRGLSLEEALRQEARLAERAKQEEARDGASRFAGGAGRHGA